jgi:hypothetical protein
MAEYEKELDDAQKLFWDKNTEYVREKMKSTSTKIRAIVEPIKAKVEEHDGLLGGLFRQMTASFGGMMKLDEKLKKK